MKNVIKKASGDQFLDGLEQDSRSRFWSFRGRILDVPTWAGRDRDEKCHLGSFCGAIPRWFGAGLQIQILGRSGCSGIGLAGLVGWLAG